jgi:hypothetical protein
LAVLRAWSPPQRERRAATTLDASDIEDIPRADRGRRLRGVRRSTTSDALASLIAEDYFIDEARS